MKNIIISIVTVVSGSGRSTVYSAIDQNGTDHASEISPEILKRAVEKWQNKVVVFFNPNINKWQRAVSVEDAQARIIGKVKEPKAPKVETSETQPEAPVMEAAPEVAAETPKPVAAKRKRVSSWEKMAAEQEAQEVQN